MTSLHPDTGTRDRQRNLDVHPGTRLLEGGSLVTATGPTYLEVFRSDLVRTVEYGDVPTPRQVGRQPRPRLRVHRLRRDVRARGGAAALPGRADRAADRPRPRRRRGRQAAGGVLRPAVRRTARRWSRCRRTGWPSRCPTRRGWSCSTGPARRSGWSAWTCPRRPGPAARRRRRGRERRRRPWCAGGRARGRSRWTGSTSRPSGRCPTPSARATDYAGRPAGAGARRRSRWSTARPGEVDRTLAVARADARAPVASAVLGDMLLEQRGPDLVALRPSRLTPPPRLRSEQPDERQPADDQRGERRGGQRAGAVAPAVHPDLGDHGGHRRDPVPDEHAEARARAGRCGRRRTTRRAGRARARRGRRRAPRTGRAAGCGCAGGSPFQGRPRLAPPVRRHGPRGSAGGRRTTRSAARAGRGTGRPGHHPRPPPPRRPRCPPPRPRSAPGGRAATPRRAWRRRPRRWAGGAARRADTARATSCGRRRRRAPAPRSAGRRRRSGPGRSCSRRSRARPRRPARAAGRSGRRGPRR